MPTEPNPTSKLVFIVDDDPNIGFLVSVAFESSGYQTRTFQDPALVLPALRNAATKPVLLVSDFQMPNLNGLELIQLCKAELPALKTISISGTLTAEAARDYLHKPDRVCSKPFKVAELLTMATDLLDS